MYFTPTVLTVTGNVLHEIFASHQQCLREILKRFGNLIIVCQVLSNLLYSFFLFFNRYLMEQIWYLVNEKCYQQY